jgi:hypothetical protein
MVISNISVPVSGFRLISGLSIHMTMPRPPGGGDVGDWLDALDQDYSSLPTSEYSSSEESSGHDFDAGLDQGHPEHAALPSAEYSVRAREGWLSIH